jgi:YHS domain-containing protein
MKTILVKSISLALIGFTCTSLLADDKPATEAELAKQKEQLARVQKLIGGWKGVGQPQRGSTKESWIEETDWAWKFSPQRTTLFSRPEKSKYFSKVELVAGDNTGTYTMLATPAAGGEPISYQGTLDKDERLVLEQASAPEGLPQRISLRFVAEGKRLLILYEGKTKFSDQLVRLAEVGMTRVGSGFGQGGAGPECVVTGGAGTMTVEYLGQKYYVCCTGCRDYFNADPAKALAEYKERKEEERKEKEAVQKKG